MVGMIISQNSLSSFYTQISRAKMNKLILAAGSATLLLFAATFAVMPAIAEERHMREHARDLEERNIRSLCDT